jgi:diaminopimelate decarboxylase
LAIADCDLTELAGRFGTPLYVYDEVTLEAAVDAYGQALAASYPAETGLTYAGKAFLCVALAQWVARRGLTLDCSGRGELHIAQVAGVPRAQILVHGVNKSEADLTAALTQAGTIVVDNLAELDRLVAQTERPVARTGRLPTLWLRIRPGLAVETHVHTQTGQEDSKFGMSTAEAVEAVKTCQERHLSLTGLHFHQGSHFHDPAPLGPALDTVLDLMVLFQDETGWIPQDLCPGGGWGVAYHEDELPHPDIGQVVKFVAEHLDSGCRLRGLGLPRLVLEPGRSIVARAGVALYRIGAVKLTPRRRWLLLDGGLVDNPRPALYGARYSALPVEQLDRVDAGPAWLGGPYCESGDVLIKALPLPNVQAGELIAVPVSGAYHLSMASNYNAACRPAVLWLARGAAELIQRRESVDDLIRRDELLWPL